MKQSVKFDLGLILNNKYCNTQYICYNTGCGRGMYRILKIYSAIGRQDRETSMAAFERGKKNNFFHVLILF